MAFDFHELDEETRDLMVEEIDLDLKKQGLHMSERFKSDVTTERWHSLIREAAEKHNEKWLASKIRDEGLLKSTEKRKQPSGQVTDASVPSNAADVLAEGEFNRFYIRAICRKASKKGETSVEVYRAKSVENPRPKSQELIGEKKNADGLLTDLRANEAVYEVFGIPSGPGSGLSVKIA